MTIHNQRIGAVVEKRKQKGQVAVILDIGAENEGFGDLRISF